MLLSKYQISWNSINSTAMRWNKYRKLGAGSYGTVYLAGEAAVKSGSFAAVKSAEFGHATSLVYEARLLDEVRDNPYIIQCFAEDVSVEEGRVVCNMLMEYAAGGTLNDLIDAYKSEGRTMPESHAAVYSYMLLNGLSHIHGKGVVHCDLKPSNILVFPTTKEDGLHHLKIADFGAAKHVWEEDDVNRLPRHRGTRVYASPESIAWGIHGTATDVWSLGATILQMITGRQPWTHEEMRDFVEMGMGPSKVISELGKDFLRKCFVIDHVWRWTVDMLLNHPFIVKNIKELPTVVEEVYFQKNPLGSNRPLVTKNLFSTPLQPPLPVVSTLSAGQSYSFLHGARG